MPCPITHLYVAGRLAQHYPSSHANDAVRDIHDGFAIWLKANKDFRQGTEEALQKNSSERMEEVMGIYRNVLKQDKVAVFSAFATGTQGPDLWVLPHEWAVVMFWRKYLQRIDAVRGALHFDLGHYNLTHAFPRVGLERIRKQSNSLDPLQRKYQMAYYLGYLSHIALDITGHIMVNVFAGAYFQQEKDWENEQGALWVNIFNNHNKIEQYFDALVKFVCFEGYHDAMKSFESTRKNDFRQPDPWYFPNYRDHLDKKLKFGTVIKTNAISNSDEDFLDLSVSLPAPFAHRYRANDAAKRVQPFIWSDYCVAYKNIDGSIKDNKLSITQIEPDEAEKPKVKNFCFDNTDSGSFYYYMINVMPNMAKIVEWGTKFYDYRAFARFLEAGKLVSVAFMDAALDYLSTGKTEIFELIRNWNLDLGLAIRIKDISAKTDKNNPTKPPRPVLIDLVNVIEEISALKKWDPPLISTNSWQGREFTQWPNDKQKGMIKKRIHVGGVASIKGSTGSGKKTIVCAESGLDIRMANFKLYNDKDEMGAYVFGITPPENPGTTDILDGKEAYKIKECVEDFATRDRFAQGSRLKVGNATVEKVRVTFLEKIQNAFTKEDLDKISVSSYGTNRLPRHVRVSACRKYVFKSTDTGNFHADKFKIFSNPSPAEEFAFAIYPLIKRSNDYKCLFHQTTFSQKDVDSLKMIRRVGVNVILLILEQKKNKSTGQTTIHLLESWIDGEKQPYVKA